MFLFMYAITRIKVSKAYVQFLNKLTLLHTCTVKWKVFNTNGWSRNMSCILKPLERKFPEVKLPDGTPVDVGRGPLTKIKEARCSRNQRKFLALFGLVIKTIVMISFSV